MTLTYNGVEGCITTPPPVMKYDHDYGVPLGLCKEIGVGVFERPWSKANVRMDCNNFQANITLKGRTEPLR